MNLPNKLTILRIVMVPVYLILLVTPFPHHYLAALAVFALASLTDLLDGKIARKHHLITNLGKFLDPLADKMLTTAAFLGFMVCGIGGLVPMMWVNFIVLLREFLVTSVRYMAASSGKVVAANLYGKIKTVSQMVAIMMAMAFEYVIELDATLGTAVLAGLPTTVLRVLYNAAIWFSALMTVVSGAVYLWENREFLKG